MTGINVVHFQRNPESSQMFFQGKDAVLRMWSRTKSSGPGEIAEKGRGAQPIDGRIKRLDFSENLAMCESIGAVGIRNML